MVAHVNDTADIFRSDGTGVTELRETGKEIAPQHLVAFARFQPALLQARPELTRERQAAHRVVERVASKVSAIDLRIHAFGRSAEARVDVVAKGELRLSAARGDLSQLFLLLRRRDRLLRVFVRPLGVRADG